MYNRWHRGSWGARGGLAGIFAIPWAWPPRMALELPPAASPAAFVAARGAHWPLLRAHTPPPWQQPLLPSIEREIHAVLPLLCTPRCRRARLLLRHGPRRRVAALRPGRQLRAALVSALQRRAALRMACCACCARPRRRAARAARPACGGRQVQPWSASAGGARVPAPQYHTLSRCRLQAAGAGAAAGQVHPHALGGARGGAGRCGCAGRAGSCGLLLCASSVWQ